MTSQDGAIGQATVRIGDSIMMMLTPGVRGNPRLAQFLYVNDTDDTHKVYNCSL
jgi:hypothetical protein